MIETPRLLESEEQKSSGMRSQIIFFMNFREFYDRFFWYSWKAVANDAGQINRNVYLTISHTTP